jgi:DNA-binding response OmpR family regulator
VYSHNREAREKIRNSLGRFPDTAMAPVDFVDIATQAALLQQMASGTIDLAILDGEAAPAGGLGAAKKLKDELLQCPPIAVLIARPADVWLAQWSGADAVLTHPVEPIELNRAIVSLLRTGPSLNTHR